jgi:hypothetical protein
LELLTGYKRWVKDYVKSRLATLLHVIHVPSTAWNTGISFEADESRHSPSLLQTSNQV